MSINKLKEAQQAQPETLSGFEDADILQRELNQQPNYYQNLQKMTDEYASKNMPRKDEMLGDIRR